MATSRITNTIKAPDGTALSGVQVVAMLMPSGGFRISDFTEVARIVRTTTNASGFWQLDLERNANVTPSNSWYEIVEDVPAANGGRRVWTIAVGASDQSLLASLVTPAEQQPTVVPAGTVYLDQPSADARYQALGSLGSSTPSTVSGSDATGSAGVSSSAARADHDHGFANDAWTSYTPSNSNVTVGSGVETAKYIRVGRTIHWNYKLTFGGTTSFGGTVEIGLPVAAADGSGAIVGSAFCVDATGNDFVGVAMTVTTTKVQIGLNNAANVVNTTTPMTWTNPDALLIYGTYEAAS